MKPFEGSFYFYILFLSLIPAIVLGLKEKKIKYYGIILSFLMMLLFIGKDKHELLYFLIYLQFEVWIIKLYCSIYKNNKDRIMLRFFIYLSILPLIILKFSHFFTTRNLFGFVGISYITFRVVQILIEVYDGLIIHINLIDLIYFLIFFPSVSSGPIDRSRRFESEINKIIPRQEYIQDYLSNGITKLMKGLFYKFILSSIIYTYWLSKIPANHTLKNIINYMYSYSFYLFFDFAGYSAIAIGVGYFLGVKLPENFNKPFISKDMKEFWDRWHMSLSFWFRDYIYTRFVMLSIKNKRFKSRYTASYIGFFITMLTMAVWHGTYIYYIIYGIYEGSMLIITDFYQRKSLFHKKNKSSTWYKVMSIFITFNVACFGLLLFSGYLFNK